MNYTKVLKLAFKYTLAAKKMVEIAPEAIKVTRSGEEQALSRKDIADAKKVINQYLQKQIEPESKDMALNRYIFVLTKIKETGYRDEEKYEFYIVPRASLSGQSKGQSTLYKTPQEAIESIPQKPGYAYRGMSFEELEDAMQRGTVKSRGGYNLGEIQKDLTFFSPEAESAQYYSSGFAPWKYKPTHNKPGVVIAIDEDQMLTPEDHPGVPEGELAADAELPTYMIDYIYYIIPEEIQWGKLVLHKDWYKDSYKIIEDFTKQPSANGYSILQIK